MLEQFLGTRFLGAKRFSLEGAEVLLPLLELLVDRAIGHGVRNVVIGMAHRGRLNVLANVLGKPLRDIFAEFRDTAIINAAGGDVKYHLGYSTDRETRRRRACPPLARLQPEPPRVDRPGGAGAGARQAGPVPRRRAGALHPGADPRRRRLRRPGDRGRDLQHVGAAGLPRAAAPSTSSSTTRSASPPRPGTPAPPSTPPTWRACSTVPILHVNGEDLEAVAQAVLLAADFRQRFHGTW